MRIGIAGIGKMGAAIAQRLIEVGHDVTVWNRSADKLRPLADARPKEDQSSLPPDAPDSTLTIVRYGVPTSLRPR